MMKTIMGLYTPILSAGFVHKHAPASKIRFGNTATDTAPTPAIIGTPVPQTWFYHMKNKVLKYNAQSFAALNKGDLAELEKLLKAGANPNAARQLDGGRTGGVLLESAVYRNNLKAIDLLCAYGAKPSIGLVNYAIDIYRSTEQMIDKLPVVKTLVNQLAKTGKHYDFEDSLTIAAKLNESAVASFLMDQKPNMSQDTYMYEKPMIYFAAHGQNELIDKMCSLRSQDAQLRTELLAAALTAGARGKIDTLKHIVTQCIPVGEQKKVIQQLMIEATTFTVDSGWPHPKKTVATLIELGGDPKATDKNDDTLLHHFISSSKKDGSTADELKDLDTLGVPIDTGNKDGVTPLMLAVKMLDLDSVIQLRKLGADPLKTDSAGKNALKYCKEGWDQAYQTARIGASIAYHASVMAGVRLDFEKDKQKLKYIEIALKTPLDERFDENMKILKG